MQEPCMLMLMVFICKIYILLVVIQWFHHVILCSFKYLHSDNKTATELLLSGSQVNHNGILSFRLPFTEFVPRPFPISGSPLIAPLWDDVNFGTIFYRVTSNVTLLQRACDQLQELFPFSGDFTPTTLFIATWDRVTQGFGAGAPVSAFTTICPLLT